MEFVLCEVKSNHNKCPIELEEVKRFAEGAGCLKKREIPIRTKFCVKSTTAAMKKTRAGGIFNF